MPLASLKPGRRPARVISERSRDVRVVPPPRGFRAVSAPPRVVKPEPAASSATRVARVESAPPRARLVARDQEKAETETETAAESDGRFTVSRGTVRLVSSGSGPAQQAELAPKKAGESVLGWTEAVPSHDRIVLLGHVGSLP